MKMDELQRHQANEEWRQVPEIPMFTVSSLGRVKKNGRLINGARLQRGYVRVEERTGKFHCVHRLVLLAFEGPPPSPKHVAAHRDGSTNNNRADNLRWATQKENLADMVVHGTLLTGEKNVRNKLTRRQAEDILSALQHGVMCRLLAKQYGVSESLVSKIKARKLWKCLSC